MGRKAIYKLNELADEARSLDCEFIRYKQLRKIITSLYEDIESYTKVLSEHCHNHSNDAGLTFPLKPEFILSPVKLGFEPIYNGGCIIGSRCKTCGKEEYEPSKDLGLFKHDKETITINKKIAKEFRDFWGEWKQTAGQESPMAKMFNEVNRLLGDAK